MTQQQQQQHIKPRIDIWSRPELSSAEGAAVRAPEWKEGRKDESFCVGVTQLSAEAILKHSTILAH